MSEMAGVLLTANDASPLFQPGTVYRASNGKKYKYLQFDNGVGNVAAVAGNVAYYYAPSGASAGATTVATSDLSDSAGVGAGVFQAVLTDQYYGWFQISGPATLNTALTAGADGNALTPVGSTDGTLDVSAAVTDHICAIAIDASAKIVMCQFPE